MAWMRGFSQLWPQHAIVRCARMKSPGLRVGESASVLRAHDRRMDERHG